MLGATMYMLLSSARARLWISKISLPVAGCGYDARYTTSAPFKASARVLGIAALVGHHDAEPSDLGVGDGPERVERAAVLADPPVVHVVRTHRVLDGEQRRDLVVPEDDLAARVDAEADVAGAILEVRVIGL